MMMTATFVMLIAAVTSLTRRHPRKARRRVEACEQRMLDIVQLAKAVDNVSVVTQPGLAKQAVRDAELTLVQQVFDDDVMQMGRGERTGRRRALQCVSRMHVTVQRL